MVISSNPASPVGPVSDTTPVGTVITQLTITLNPSNAGPFTGTVCLCGLPYGNDNGMFALSGNDVVLVANPPPGSSVQHISIMATQR